MRMRPERRLLLVLVFIASVACQPRCEEWCKHACEELNGNVEMECGDCDTSDPVFTCHAEAPDFKSWKKRAPSGDEPMYTDTNEAGARSDAYEYHAPHEHQPGACEFATIIDHKAVNRTWLLSQEAPVLIRGATDGWAGRSKWQLESMIETYGDAYYHVEHSGNVPLGALLRRSGKYNMGHMVWPADECYAETFRPYSPFLQTTAADYEVPHYLHPMRTFQMGIGTGEGIGVPPEQHPSAWFSAVIGRKRWILTAPGPQPPTAMRNSPGCHVARKATTSLTCDQLAGDTLWVPDFWWHETCGLDAYSVGIGGITYEGAEKVFAGEQRSCGPGGYRMNDVKYCKEYGCPAMQEATIKRA